MDSEPSFYAENPEDEVNVGRYLRFVIVFLFLIFGALGIYEYYYGGAAMEAQRIQQKFDEANGGPATAVATSSSES